MWQAFTSVVAPITSVVAPITAKAQSFILKLALKNMVGEFLESDLSLDKLDLQITKGQIELRDLEFNVSVRP